MPLLCQNNRVNHILLSAKTSGVYYAGLIAHFAFEVLRENAAFSRWKRCRSCEADEFRGVVGVCCLARGVLFLRMWYNDGVRICFKKGIWT